MDEETTTTLADHLRTLKGLHGDIESYLHWNEIGGQPPVPVDQILHKVNDSIGVLISVLDTLTSVVAEVESQLDSRLSDSDIFEAWYRELVRRW